jgi:hypothetical protein
MPVDAVIQMGDTKTLGDIKTRQMGFFARNMKSLMAAMSIVVALLLFAIPDTTRQVFGNANSEKANTVLSL